MGIYLQLHSCLKRLSVSCHPIRTENKTLLTHHIAVLKKVRYALCPMPYALCPMHVGHLMLLKKAILATC
ncbi:hypothetical protein [Microcoleus sp.]|uniref:hypothetical protein n=1 Tax=Microcoleus sp. TaxID=44472 RepID=UPI00403E9019